MIRGKFTTEKRSRLKKALTVLLCAALTLCFVGCDKSGGKKGSAAEVEVWTVRSTEKIIRSTDYSEKHGSKTIYVDTLRNETESAQIVMSLKGSDESVASADNVTYDVQISDLKNGDKVFSANNISVFHEKYVYLPWTQYEAVISFGLGIDEYPDALLPLETAKEYGENSFDGRNQAVWISFKTPKDQPAGTYTGSFRVTAGGKGFDVPVSVRVRDYTLSDTVHSKTSFAIEDSFIGYSEQDTTLEMAEEYYEFFLDRRIQAQSLPGVSYSYADYTDPGTLENTLAGMVKYAGNPKCSCYNLAYSYVSVTGVHIDGTECTGSTCNHDLIWFECEQYKVPEGTKCEGRVGNTRMTTFSEDQWDVLFPAMVERSLQTGIDLFEKAETYFLFCDEFNGYPHGPQQANYNMWHANHYCDAKAVELAAKTDYITDTDASKRAEKYVIGGQEVGYDAFKQKVCKSLAEVKHKFVGYDTDSTGVSTTTDESASGESRGAIVTEGATLVPFVMHLQKESERGFYEEYDKKCFIDKGERGERWTYTCLQPHHPYSNYLIGTHILSPRIYSWERYEDNIVGDLYWMTNEHIQHKVEADGTEKMLYDYYELHGFGGREGTITGADGVLTYPGRPYGIYGPVSTLRVEGLADGLEEYDMLWALEDAFKQAGLNSDGFDRVLNLLTGRMYHWFIMRSRSTLFDSFDTARAALLSMLEMSENADVLITDYTVDGAEHKFTLRAPDDATVASDVGTVAETGNSGGYKTYTVTVVGDKESNGVLITATRGGKSYTVDMYLGGKNTVVGNSELVSLLQDGFDVTANVEAIGGKDGALVLSYKDVPQANPSDEVVPSAEFDVSGMKIDETSEKVEMSLYNSSDEDLQLEIVYQTARKNEYVSLTEITLKAHEWTDVELLSILFNTERAGSLKRLVLNLTDANGDSVRDVKLGLDAFTVYR